MRRTQLAVLGICALVGGCAARTTAATTTTVSVGAAPVSRPPTTVPIAPLGLLADGKPHLTINGTVTPIVITNGAITTFARGADGRCREPDFGEEWHAPADAPGISVDFRVDRKTCQLIAHITRDS